ncbi:MAG: GIY-YIG nuclease family protein [Patescibacteria group bacterium]|nr:GIY-YIG nuclease family protein [Patescibacteria group bacterium]
MKYQDVAKKKLPDTPGVYFFLGPRKKILYIGKATSLRDRVKSYFIKDVISSRGPQIAKMIEDAVSIDVITTDSVLEALILEAHLIKKHQPKYNTKEKDDTSFNYILITDEDFPRVLLVRGRELLKEGVDKKVPHARYVAGPFPQGTLLRDAMKIIRKIFPFRDTCVPGSGKPCFNRQIGLCPGVCTGETLKAEYQKTIANLTLFLEGKKSALIKKLLREMKAYAKKQEFEKAHNTKKTIFTLRHIQDIALLKNNQGGRASFAGRIEAYDIAHISGKYLVGVMAVVLGGEPDKSEYRKFKIRTVAGADDTASLAEILRRRFEHSEWTYPRLIVIDGGIAQKNRAQKVLKDLGIGIPVVSVVKDERHRPREILGNKEHFRKCEREILFANSEAHRFAVAYHRTLRDRI